MTKSALVLVQTILLISVVNFEVVKHTLCVQFSQSDVRNCHSVVWRNVTVSNQSQLDEFVANVSSQDESNKATCIQLSFTGMGRSFKLDLLQLMRINLVNGSLVITGNSVNINCITNVTDSEELRKLLHPISRALLVLFDGLVFTRCPVPIVFEEVSNVIIQNCVFL